MRKTALGLGLVVIVAGCADPVATDSSQIAAVVVDQVWYTPRARVDLQASAVGEQHATVVRKVDCSAGLWRDDNTHVSEYCPLQDGESNYLPEGTPIYRIQGVDPGDALAVFYADEWERLHPIHAPGVTR